MLSENTERYHRSLQATFEEIAELLEKQDLVRDLAHRQTGERQALVDALIERQQAAELQRRMDRLHPADAAYVLERLPTEPRRKLWELVRAERRGAVLLEMADAVRDSLIAGMGASDLAAAAEHLDSDQIADLVPSLPRDAVTAIMGRLAAEDRSELSEVLRFPPGTVGALMELDMVTVREDVALDVVLRYLRRLGELPDVIDQIFVVDREGTFTGILRLKDLLTHDPDDLVASVMVREPLVFGTDDPAREAVAAFDRYDLVCAPVVNLHGKLAGVLRFDVVMDYMSEAAENERLKQVGLREDEDLFAPLWRSTRNRWPWLAMNLITAFLASRVIGAFESTIEQLVALAALMPIVASLGGNTGNQTVALVIRSLALDQIHRDNIGHVLRKEAGISVVNGLIWGSFVGLLAALIYHDLALAGVMAAAVLANLLIASVAGVAIPVMLNRTGRDPVLGSSVMLTFITDAMGFLVFLGMAAAVLV